MKVVLFALNGSWSHSSLAIRCLRAPLEADGFEVVLCERSLRDRTSHILETLYSEHAAIYSFSCYIWNLEETLRIARSLKALLPESRVVLGGPEVSYELSRFEDMDWVDAIVCGEGEDALLRYCRAVRNGEDTPRILQGGVPAVMRDEGILYREGDNTGSLLYYESSRGCPYRCAYCLSSATHGVRMKSVEQTLKDLEAFESLSLPCRVIKLVDRTFNADPARANAIWLALAEERFTKQYHFEICASLLNEESFSILSSLPRGKVQLEIGLQSTNPQTLDACARHIDPDRVIDAVKRLRQAENIHLHLDLIAGLPYEGYARFAKSFDDAYGCAHLLQLGFLKLLYGTSLRERAEEYGYVATEEPPYTVLRTKWMSYEEMQRLHAIAELMERYEESGRFAHTMFTVRPLMQSPFAFWEGLALYFRHRDARPVQRISQPDIFLYLSEYLAKIMPHTALPGLRAMLRADFEQHEHKAPPHFLRDV